MVKLVWGRNFIERLVVVLHKVGLNRGVRAVGTYTFRLFGTPITSGKKNL